MVKLGFICEGKTERLIVESENFQRFLTDSGIACIHPVIDANGVGNLLPHNIISFLEILKSNGAQKIIILTDLDEDACITVTKNRITSDENRIIIVAVRKIESWFLADNASLSSLLKEKYNCPNPENEKVPFETIKNLFLQKNKPGPGTKINLTRNMLKNGFTVQNAAKHSNCPSAAYFLNKLELLATNN
jgi:hypothetical protein